MKPETYSVPVEYGRADWLGQPEFRAAPTEPAGAATRPTPPAPAPVKAPPGPNPAAFPPEAVRPWMDGQEEEARRRGAVRANATGYAPDGGTLTGADVTNSLCRKLHKDPVRGHDEMGILLNGVEVFTQAPCCHEHLAPCADDDGRIPREVKAVIANGVQRRVLAGELRDLDPRACGIAPSRIDRERGKARR